jgi:DNA-binding LytR/AlgR family response regulator
MTRPTLRTLDTDLAGRRVLVVEDEWFIADEISAALDRHRATVIGPAGDVALARTLIQSAAKPDCAVLDINLRGQMVFEFAEELTAQGVGIVFATGYDAAMIPPRFNAAPRFEKPLNIEALLTAVAQACGCSR